MKIKPISKNLISDPNAKILPIEQIRTDENIRGSSDLQELLKSIQMHGVLNPLLVTPCSEGFLLLGGHRRLECAQLLGFKEVPCRIIQENHPHQALPSTLHLIDNLCREPLKGWEICKAIYNLRPLFPNQVLLAEAIHKSETYVSRAIAVVESKPDLARVQDLSLNQLFQELTKKSRNPSGPQPGGRAIAKPLQYRERNRGKSFHLSIHFDSEKTAPRDREKIILQLKEILNKLEYSEVMKKPKWQLGENRKFKRKTVTKKRRLPHMFKCSNQTGHGLELD